MVEADSGSTASAEEVGPVVVPCVTGAVAAGKGPTDIGNHLVGQPARTTANNHHFIGRLLPGVLPYECWLNPVDQAPRGQVQKMLRQIYRRSVEAPICSSCGLVVVGYS